MRRLVLDGHYGHRVEIDRCATDAVPIVTGCRMGKRALKFRDFGKVAATFSYCVFLSKTYMLLCKNAK